MEHLKLHAVTNNMNKKEKCIISGQYKADIYMTLIFIVHDELGVR